MRVERLPSMLTHAHLCVSIGDDGLGGYRDTEALGVVGARSTDSLNKDAEAEEWAALEMAARARTGRFHPPGSGLGVLLGR